MRNPLRRQRCEAQSQITTEMVMRKKMPIPAIIERFTFVVFLRTLISGSPELFFSIAMKATRWTAHALLGAASTHARLQFAAASVAAGVRAAVRKPLPVRPAGNTTFTHGVSSEFGR